MAKNVRVTTAKVLFVENNSRLVLVRDIFLNNIFRETYFLNVPKLDSVLCKGDLLSLSIIENDIICFSKIIHRVPVSSTRDGLNYYDGVIEFYDSVLDKGYLFVYNLNQPFMITSNDLICANIDVSSIRCKAVRVLVDTTTKPYSLIDFHVPFITIDKTTP